MRTRLTCVVATFDLAPFQGAPPWDGLPGVETPYVFSAPLNRPGRPSYPIIPYPTRRFFRGTLFQALRARLRSVSSLRDAMADVSQQHLARCYAQALLTYEKVSHG